MALDVERVREIADRVAASSGLEIVDIEFLGGGKARMLRVFLDKSAAGTDPLAGVTHEDCAKFSREFGTILDVEDVMPGAYVASARLAVSESMSWVIERSILIMSGRRRRTWRNVA